MTLKEVKELNEIISKNNKIKKEKTNEVMTLKEVKALRKEMARIKEENEILKKLWPYLQQEIR